MADYHILQASSEDEYLAIAMHVPIPAGQTNEVGEDYRELIATHESTISQVPDISQAEADALVAGSLVEEMVNFRTHPDISTATSLARLDALYLETVIAVRQQLVRKYRYYGFERDVD